MWLVNRSVGISKFLFHVENICALLGCRCCCLCILLMALLVMVWIFLFAGYGGLEWGNNLNSVSFGLMFVCSYTEFLFCM